MEKSITEHPEFEKDGQRNLELFEGTILDAREMFDAGGEAAQAILQKQHDEEKVKFACEFAGWLALNAHRDYHNGRPTGQWFCDNGMDGNLYTSDEIFRIFRKLTARYENQ